jgi:TonB-dependent receptor-like protein
MKRRALFKTVAAFGAVTAIPFADADELSAWPVSAGGQDDSEGKKSAVTNPLTPPASGHIPVAFVLSKETAVIDFAGPWEVFQKAKVSGRSRPFRPYTVAENNKAMDVQFGGMKILPEYGGAVSFASLNAFAADDVNTATFTQALPVNGLRKFTYFGYFQDELKWTQSLTLNLGARYSFFNIFHEVEGGPNPFDFATCGPAGFCGVGTSFGQPTYRDIDPRVAIAWAPAAFQGKTVVRAGFGVYHQDGQLDDQNVPESNEVESLSLSQATIPNLTYPVDSSFTGVPGVISPSAMQRDRRDMYVTQWGLFGPAELAFCHVRHTLLRRQQRHALTHALLRQRHRCHHTPAPLSPVRPNQLARQRKQ